jgi:UDP-N-acetylmuramoylalanine--D-glutamate ligase
MNLTHKNIVVVGLGLSGAAAARFLQKRGATVTGTDTAPADNLDPGLKTLEAMGISLELGRHRAESFRNADLVVLSPGVPHTIEPVALAREQGIPIMGEIELASRFIRQPVVAVTGTNGKTTTTELLGDMLSRSGFEVFVGGNIGNPLIGYADGPQTADIIVAEISSFQLDTIAEFRPHIGLLLNITADHLDRYPSFEAYAASKIRLFENQQETDVAVLNGSDPMVRSLSGGLKSRKLVYPNPESGEEGARLNGKQMTLHTVGPNSPGADTLNSLFKLPKPRQTGIRDHLPLDLSGIKLVGRHNLENACAAGLAAMAAGAGPEAIQQTLNTFQGSPHRLEHVARIDHVDFYNDSKATNVDAVLRAVECFDRPVVLIMGGLDKGGDFKILGGDAARRIKKLIVLGQAADLIRTALEGALSITPAASMAAAVKLAYQAGSEGDVVLLSPGCASFDMYRSYAQRGDDFKQSVNDLKRERST